MSVTKARALLERVDVAEERGAVRDDYLTVLLGLALAHAIVELTERMGELVELQRTALSLYASRFPGASSGDPESSEGRDAR